MALHATSQIDLVRVDDGEIPAEELQKIETAVQTATEAKEVADAASEEVEVITKRIVIDDDSVDIVDSNNNTLASYGEEMVLGRAGEMQLIASNDGMKFGKDHMYTFWLDPKAMRTDIVTSENAFSPSEVAFGNNSTDLMIEWPAFFIYNVQDAAGRNWTNVAQAHHRYPVVAIPVDKSGITFPVKVSYAVGGTFMEENAAGEIKGRFEAYDHTATRLSLSMGSYIAAGVLSSTGGQLAFSIPLGRAFSEEYFIKSISFGIVVRASNAAGTGTYIIKSASGGSSPADFSYESDKTYSNSDPLMVFYDGANNKRTPSLKPTIELCGGSNIYFNWPTNTNDYFTGNTTVRNNCNNNACTVWLSNIEIEFGDGSLQLM